MPDDREQVDAEAIRIERDLSRCLGSVTVDQGAVLMGDGRQFPDGLKRSGLVVGGHHRDDRPLAGSRRGLGVPEQLLEERGLDKAVRPHRQDRDTGAVMSRKSLARGLNRTSHNGVRPVCAWTVVRYRRAGLAASTRAKEQPAHSGIALPPGVSRSRRWSWFRENRGRHRLFRAGRLRVVGLLLILVGAAMWLLSLLLALPPIFVGLWVWSREFQWHTGCSARSCGRAGSLWSRVKSRPVRWAAITLGGVGVACAGYWAWGHYGLVGMR